MLARRSLFLDHEQCGPEIERTFSKIRTKKRDSKKKMAENKLHLSNLRSISPPPLKIHLHVPTCPCYGAI